MVLPPILAILRLRTAIRSMDKSKINIPVTRSETPLVDVNGETKTVEDACVPCL